VGDAKNRERKKTENDYCMKFKKMIPEIDRNLEVQTFRPSCPAGGRQEHISLGLITNSF